jgi:predicted  nucleic acid-binding Zn-ribbon protein
MITLNDKRLHDYIVDKDTLVFAGRKISGQIDEVEKKIAVFEKKEKEITGKTEPKKELKDEGDKLAKSIESTMKRLEEIGNIIQQQKLDAIPKEMKEEHQALMKEREKLERDRNKIALKVQKIKDVLVPLVQKACRPLLKEYEDIETAKAKDGKVVINTFNHLDDWKRKFKSK